MKRHFTIFKSCLVLMLILLMSQANAQVTYSESFDNTTFLPTGWSAVGTSTLWTRRTTSTFPTTTPQAGAAFARFAARAQTPGTAQTISTPVIDYTTRGSQQATFSFWVFRDNGSVNGDSISVYANTSASLTGAVCFGTVARYTRMAVPDTVPANGWYKYTFNVPSSFTGATNYILIKGISQNGNNISIDEVQWNAFPNLCTGKPSPGTATAVLPIICGGLGSTSIVLNGQTTGYAGINFQWKVASALSGPWSNTGTNASALNTGTITSTKYYKCIVSCSYSGQSDSCAVINVIVRSTPNPVIAVTPQTANYCAGATPTKIYASGASTYVWSPSTGLNVSNSDTVYAAPSASTAYTVRGTDTAGCSATANVVVNLRQGPTVNITSADTLLCYGTGMQLFAQVGGGGGGNTYLWSPSGQTTNAILASPQTSTQFGVTVTNNFGCKGSAFKNITVIPKPVAKFDVQVYGRTYHFSDSSISAQQWLWDFGDGMFSHQQNPTYTYSGNGPVNVMLVALNPPCKADTFYRSFNVSSIVSNNAIKGLSVYPNPAQDELFIQASAEWSTQTVRIFDMTSRQVFEQVLHSQEAIKLPVAQWPKGVYMLQTNFSTQKLIID